MSEAFLSRQPSVEDYWRSVILFGRNVASYKFALAEALLELKPQSGQLVKLSDLALPYAKSIARHLRVADKQGTFGSSQFLDACRRYNQEPDDNKLVEATVRLGFNNVIDAFHVVGQQALDRPFYVDERAKSSGIRITDEFSSLIAGSQATNLPVEVESRWRLVETAWELGLSRGVVGVNHDGGEGTLFAVDKNLRRKSVTSTRGALNGYQKGFCFYCFAEISLDGGDRASDVDHFFPHVLKQVGFAGVDGIWNLVLSCKECNRGAGGKFDRVPAGRLLARLHRRNEFLIQSHHPLRETLMLQTGVDESRRKRFLEDAHSSSRAALIHQWEPELRGSIRF